MTNIFILFFCLLLSGPTWAQAAEPYPNLPAGLNLLYQYDGNVLPTDSTSSIVGMTAGYGNRFFGGHSITTDATAPVDPSSVYTHTYPAGSPGGSSNGQLNFWNTAAPRIPVTTYYEMDEFKINGSSFEGPGTGQWKALGYWGMAVPSGGYSGTLYNVLSCGHQVGTTAAGVLCDSWTFGIAEQGVTAWRFDAGTIQNNKWYRVEMLIIMNNPVTSANGTLKVWLTNITDGGGATLVINSTNRQFRNASNPDGVWVRHYDPVWGGSSFGPKTRSDSISFARFVGYGNSSGTTPPPTDTTAPSPPTNVKVN